MANTIKLKRGSGSDPGTSDLSVGELAIRTDTALLFTKNDGGSVVPIGISDGDKGDITVSSNGGTFTIDNDAVTTAKIVDGVVTADKIASQTITADKIANDAVNTGELADGSVTAAKIATNVITADKIASGGVNTGEIADDAVTYAKIQNVTQDRILGRQSSGSGVVEELNAANVRLMINVEDGATADQSASEIVALIADQTIAPSTIDMEDSEQIKLGNGDDLTLVHDGSNSTIDSNTGTFIIRSDGGGLKLLSEGNIILRDNDDTTNLIRCINGGQIELYHNGTKRLETTSDGITVTEGITIDAPDNVTSTGGDFALQLLGGDAINDIVNLRFATGADGSLANISALAEATGSYPNSSGSLILSVQSGGGTFEGLRINSSRNVGIGTTSPSTKLHVNGTVTATAFAGDGSSLTGISAGATGGGSDEVFYENDQNVTTDYTITNGKNAMSAGPITIDSGVTVTVGAGETLTIV